jgi:hypothetical protein
VVAVGVPIPDLLVNGFAIRLAHSSTSHR